MTAHPRLSLCALAASAIALPAFAGAAIAQEDPGAPHSVTLRYDDLDLHSREGAQVMLQRIAFAADQACGGEADARRLDRRALFRACRSQTIARAVRELDAPLMTAMADHSFAPIAVASAR